MVGDSEFLKETGQKFRIRDVLLRVTWVEVLPLSLKV